MKKRLGLIGLALLLAGLAALGWWGLYTTAGTATLLRWVPGLVVEAPNGSLLGGAFAARKVAWHAADGAGVTLDDVAWQGLEAGLAGAGPQWLKLHLRELRAARVQVDSATSPGAAPAAAAPADLGLPLELTIDRLSVGELHAAALGDRPVREVELSLGAGVQGGGLHRVERLRLRWDRLRVSGDLRIGSRAPLPLEASIALAPDAAMQPDWRAHLRAEGPLADLAVGAALRALPVAAGAELPSLDASARLHPFAPWPLAALSATARALDLQQFHSGAPRTLLDADARVSTRGWDEPAEVQLTLANRDAGRHDEGRLPLRAARIGLSGRLSDAQRLTFDAFDVELGSAAQEAGRLRGSGSVDLAPGTDRLALQTRLERVQPALLDARASPMTLDGTLDLTVERLSREDRVAQLEAGIDARMPQLPRPGRILLSARASTQRVELLNARAAVGDAAAELSGSAERSGTAWHVAGRGKLERFDPGPYWRGPANPAWRNGPHRLNGSFGFELTLDHALGRASGSAAVLAALAGQATLKLHDSVLAGVPLAADVALTGRGSQVNVAGALVAAGNRLQLDGRVATDPRRASADHWQAELQAPALAALQPLIQLVAPGSSLAGAAELQASVDGRWPALRSSGTANAQDLRAAGYAVRRADAKWSLGSAAADALELGLNLEGVSAGAQQPIDSARLAVTGSWAAHRVEFSADSALRPPGWVDSVAPGPAAAATGTVARLAASGGLLGGLEAPAGWRVQVELAEVGARGAADAPPWLRLRDLRGAVDLDRSTRAPARVSVEPGRAEILGAALRWERLLWQSQPGAALIDAQASLEPLPVVPLLQRLQPDFGWGGDLSVRGSLNLKSTPAFSADVVLERSGGDLSVRDVALPDAPPRALDLTDLRFGLVARDGTWSFTQAVAGRTLGNAAGAAVLRTDAQRMWPPPDAALEGVLQANVADLGGWGAWLPAGWRLAGKVDAAASFGGRLGAPAYTGHIRGSALGVRNLLEGVEVHDGTLEIALQGETARIERFDARAGDGLVKLTGDADFGAAPRARLELTAQRFELLRRVDRRIVASGNAALALAGREIDLKGSFTVDEGLVDFTRSDAPALSSDVVVLRPEAAGTRQPAAAPGAARRNVALDLTVDLGRDLRVRGRGIDTLLGGSVRITSPGGRLALDGTVRTRSGTYAAYGQKLEIERGELTFTGSPETPRLDILAIRPNLDVRVGVAVIGTVQAPRVRLYSEPEMSDIDKLSWLVLGRAGDELGRTDTALLQRAALALLAGEGGGPTDALTRALGLDTFSVRQDSEGEVTQTVVSIGKQLSQRWYVGYERSLNATAGTWQLIYRVAQRFTLRAQGGYDNSFDAIWTWRWN